MRRRILIALAPLLLLAAPARAAEPSVGQYVDLQLVGLPVIVDGRLLNYVFVSVRVVLADDASASHWREKEPYFRDVLVRDGNRTPFTKAGDYNAVDVGKLTAALTRDISAITGPGVVRAIQVTSQAPRKRLPPPPKPAA